MKFIVVGCGRMGSTLARTLVLREHTVTVVDQDPTTFAKLGPGFRGKTVVGVGFDRDVLIEAGIQKTDGLAAMTPSDEMNVVAGRMAQQIFRVPRVVARVNDPRKAEIYRRLGLQTVSPVVWGVNRVAELLTYSQLAVVQTLGGGQVDLVEVEVSQLLVGRKVADVMVQGELHVVAVTRGGRTFLPTLGTIFEHGDYLHLVMRATSAERVKAVLGLG